MHANLNDFEGRKVHVYTDAGEAYDATQIGDVMPGELIVVAPPNEPHATRVVGYLNGAWPVAVTQEHGCFHHAVGTPDSPVHASAQRLATELKLDLH